MLYGLKIIILLRLHNVAAAVLSVAAGYYMSASSWRMPWMLLSAAALAAAGGNVINDYYDLDIDSINKPGRALPSGSVKRRDAGILYAAVLAPMLILLPMLPAAEAIWIAAWIILLFMYSSKLKRTYLAGNILVAAVAASAFPLGALAGGRISAGVLPAAYAFFFVIGRELVKDCEDIEGDMAFGAKTVPVVSGKKKALGAASGIFLALAAAFPLPIIWGVYNRAYMWIMLISVLPILLVSSILSLDGRKLGLTSFLLKVGMFSGITAFLLGSAG